MNKNLTRYLFSKLNNILEDESKLLDYIKYYFKEEDFIGFEQYLQNNFKETYDLYLESLTNFYKDFDFGSLNIDYSSINMFTINNFNLYALSKLIISNKDILEKLKEYLMINPLNVLINFEEFLSVISTSISPVIQSTTGVVFVDKDYNASLFLNNTSKNNYVSLNKAFLRICLKILAESFTSGDTNFSVSVRHNKLTFNYGDTTYNSILINKSDLNSVLKSFGFPTNEEKLVAINLFYNNNIPYDFLILYLSNINEFFSDRYPLLKLKILEKYRVLHSIPFFKRIEEQYSVGISILLYSICPFPETYEYILSINNNNFNKKINDSFIFSFALWFLDKKSIDVSTLI